MAEELKNGGQETPKPANADGGGQQPAGGERVFTEAELNSIIRDRLERERGKYADYEKLKTAAEQWEQHRQAQMSELERAQTRITELEAATQAAQEQAAQTLIRSAFLAEAAKAGAQHPEDAYLLAELNGVDVGDDGKVAGVTEAVAALIEAGRLVMAGRQRAPNLDGGAGSGARGGDRSSVERAVAQLTAEELRFAQRMSLTAEQYAESKLEMAHKQEI